MYRSRPPSVFLTTAFLLATGMWLCVCVKAGEIEFNRDVLPLLSESCFQCHGPDGKQRKADLRLDTVAGATRDLGGYAALSPGKPDESELIIRIETEDPDEMMPPPDSGKKLTVSQRATLRQWIQNGGKYEAHWAFQPIAEGSVPAVPSEGDAAKASPIDAFLSEKLTEAGLTFSPQVNRQKLIRRATFDLTGLPPKWSEVEAFVNDKSPDAFAKVLDRLLESPAYGERWGRHWLDVARYADTHGASAIGFTRFEFSYTFRDYVVQAFNADLPYDRFVVEQLAADQLKLDDNDPANAALGFLTVGRRYRNVHDRLDDQIDVISRGLLGLTVACARCHDHKFDPIPTTDYYSLYATLSNSRMPNELPLVGNPEVPEKYRDDLKQREQQRDDVVFEQGEVLRGRLRMQVGLYLRELAAGTPEQDTATSFLSYRTEDLRPVILERWRAYLKKLDENDPVFGPWHRLSKLEPGKDFPEASAAIIQELTKQNGDPKAFADEHRIATKAPQWNPRVLEALSAKPLTNFVEVADVYGEVFTEVNRQWLTALLEASLEASTGGTLVPDQDVKHRIVNSAIERQLRHHLYHPETPTALSFEDGENFTMINRGVRDSVSGTLGAIRNLNLTANAPPRAMMLKEVSTESKDAYVFLRGNPVVRGEKVTPRFLTALSGENPESFSDGERRLGLARSIVDPENPLARRVIVNWVWQHHFGQGLVRTSDDFGTRGDPPTHPELLDYLARTFLEEDQWSLKKLHRRIMLTTAYQQASLENPAAREKDPTNLLLWRIPARKLEMEAMRDSLLAASGELDFAMGGRPFEEKENQVIPRRSVYAFVNRDVIGELASTFDGADPSACTVKRPETMVPQQTLFALNSDYIQNRAKALAALPEIQNASIDEIRLQRIYQRVYSRLPEAEEVAVGLAFLGKAENKTAALPQLVHALLAANEFHFVD